MKPARPGRKYWLRAAAEEALEAEAAFERHRLVRIAFAGRDGIADAGDEHVADRDLAHHALRRAVAERNIDRRDGRAAVGQAQLDFLLAGRVDLPDRAVCRRRRSRRRSRLAAAVPDT